ncbi:MAG: BREX-4 system phosphatase PglZ [Christensenellaceae bacterium]|jgi:hypothetical protein|nr:BREX-4 system phosphatase PglZ [Christensenellaceae bacterium]
MAIREATTKEACDYFNGHTKAFPIIVNVQTKTDYCTILNALNSTATFLRVSNYFQSDSLPDIDRMQDDILSAGDNTVVLGFFQFLCFNGGFLQISSAISKICDLSKHVLILTYGLLDIIQRKANMDPRIAERAQIFLIEGDPDIIPKITLTSFDFASLNFYETLEKYFLFVEYNGAENGVVKSSTLRSQAFNNRVWSVQEKNSAFELLKDIDTGFAVFDEGLGSNTQWEQLLKDIKGKTFRELLSTLGNELLSAIKKFKAFDSTQKWYIFLWLKSEKNLEYLSLVAKKVSLPKSIISEIYNAILDVKVTDKSFKGYYNQRKALIATLDNEKTLKEFLSLNNALGRDKIYYLTDNSQTERKEIITCITQHTYSADEIKKISKEVYPILAEYLSDFDFKNEDLNKYFDEYRIQKVKNVLTEDFRQKVNKYAETRPFYKWLKSRSIIISQIDFKDALVYWVDALGAEFCSLIMHRCKHYDLSAKIQIAWAELPTLTEFNSGFYDCHRGDKSIKDLDKLKHMGEEDHDYSKTKLPLYIESELSIIDEIIKTAQAALLKAKKVIILSDHGASRLIRIADNILTIEVDTREGEKNEKHGGRCCIWNPDVAEKYKTVTDYNNNGFCVIANYDRFKGGKYTGVELHGGATIEEVVVPIIEITEKVEAYSHILTTKVLKLRGRQADQLSITLSREVEAPKIKIEGQANFILPISKNASTYSFETNIVKAGKYECGFFDDNEEIVPNIKFEVQSALGAIIDLFNEE